MGFAAGDTNIRRYTGNTVVSQIDPTGLEFFDPGSGMTQTNNGDIVWKPENNASGDTPAAALERVIKRIKQKMNNHHRKGGENACFAYRDCVNAMQIDRDEPFVDVFDGGVVNWWGPPFQVIMWPLDGQDINVISDGGVFIRPIDDPSDLLYIHASPRPFGNKPVISVDDFPDDYLLGQPKPGDTVSPDLTPPVLNPVWEAIEIHHDVTGGWPFTGPRF